MMEQNKSSLSSSIPPPSSTPILDQISMSGSDETPQSFSSFFSGRWMNNVVLEQSPSTRLETGQNNNNVNQNSLMMHNSDDVVNNYVDLFSIGTDGSFELDIPNFSLKEECFENNMLDVLLDNYNTTIDGVITDQCYSNSETTQVYSFSSSTQITTTTTNNYETAQFCSLSTISTHDNLSTPTGYIGLLSDVVNFDSTKRKPPAAVTSLTTQFCSLSTLSTHDNLSTPIRYTGLLSDVVNFDSAKKKPLMTQFPPQCNGVVPTTSGRANNLKIKKKNTKAWSIDEHKLFLVGMYIYGQGDWKNIADYVVITKTHIQVASHAQKYFLRQQHPLGQKRKRPSIHDITTFDHELLMQVQARLSIECKRS